MLDARGRVESILWEGRLRAFVTWSGGDPAVCFTEATLRGLEYLIGNVGYSAWGLVFERQSVYDAGGGPVWHVRADEYRTLRALSSRVQAWSVRLLPKAFGTVTDEMAAVLRELEGLMEQRADAKVSAAVADGEPWARRCGQPPQGPAARQAWTGAVRVVAAYRDLHGVDGDEPLGPMPLTDRERIDFNRAASALRDARACAAGLRDEAAPVVPAAHRLDSFSS